MDNHLQDILNSIDELANRGGITRSRAFAAWYAINFFDLGEDDALEAAASDGGNDQGIDIAFADDSSQELVILQAHCPENFVKKTPVAKWHAASASLPYLINPAELVKLGRPDLAETLSSLKTAHPDYTITVGLITLGLKNDAIDRYMQAQSRGNVYHGFTFFHLAQEEIAGKYKALVEAEAGIPDDTLSFCEQYFEDSGAYGRAWVGSVSAVELARLYDKHGAKLFAGNIRLFLGTRKGGINEQIIKTAKESPGNFWALNNGITIVADHAAPAEDSTLTLKRFSIVNGCQTTSSLVRAGAATSAKVLARVIAAKVGLKNDIVRYNNSQNAVKIWAVRAADDVQEDLRRAFLMINVDYAPKQEGSLKRRKPNIIELDKVTQFLAAAEQEYLIQAIDNKSQLFDEPYQKLFKKGIKPQAVYLSWLIGNLADQLRRERVEKLRSKEDPNVNLLSVTSGYWIIYCVYKLMAEFSDLDSVHITLQKMTSEEFSNALKKYVNQAIDMFYDAAIDAYDREEYGSFKSTLRSAKFLQKIDSKVNLRITRLPVKLLPDLASVARLVKLSPPAQEKTGVPIFLARVT
jgi:hypothetical protein